MFFDILFQGSEPQDLFCVLHTSMCDIAHETEHDLEVLTVDFMIIFYALANEPQDLQTTKDHLMFSHAYRRRLHQIPPVLTGFAFE
jgi:hypothetical protein